MENKDEFEKYYLPVINIDGFYRKMQRFSAHSSNWDANAIKYCIDNFGIKNIFEPLVCKFEQWTL